MINHPHKWCVWLMCLMYGVFINPSISFSQVENCGTFINSDKTDTIFVITNRAEDSNANQLAFINEVRPDSSLVFLKVIKSTTNQLHSQKLSYNEFLSQTSLKPSDWLLFVHGDSKTYTQSVYRGFAIQNLHNVNVIVYSWPSKNPDNTGMKNLNNSRRNIEKSMHHFKGLLSFMSDFRSSNSAFKANYKSSMLLHSLGNYYLKNLMVDSTFDQNKNLIFDNLIMNAAAVNHKDHVQWVENIKIQKQLYITNNKSDFNLKGLHIFSKSGNQLGEKAKAPLADNAQYFQFTKSIGFRFPTCTSHTYFISTVPEKSENIRSFYFDLLHGKSITTLGKSYYVKNKKGLGFDVLF